MVPLTKGIIHMENIRGFISSELRLPNKTSTKKKRYVTFKCHKCDEVVEKIYTAKTFIDECTSCSKGAFTTEEFIQKGREIFGNKYDYSLTKYKNKRSDVTIICPEHGEFTQKGQEHLEGHGCRKCGDIQRSLDQQLSIEEWGKRLAKHPKIKFKDTPTKLGYHTKVKFICEDHGEFENTLGSLIQTKNVCNQCTILEHQKQSIRNKFIGKTAYLYLVYLPDVDKYKLGVTTNKRNRFSTLGKVIEILIEPMEYTKAVEMEHKLMNDLVEYRYKGLDKLVKNGSTELFTTNIYPYIKRALQE